MLDGNRRKLNPTWIAITAIAVGATILVAAWLWSMKLGYNNARDHQPNEQAENTGEVCVEFPFSISICHERTDAEREAARNEDDLKAQQEMADWAFFVVLFSGLGFVASLAGIALVYATFRKTAEALDTSREANRITRRIGEAQIRAYIGIEHVSIEGFVANEFQAVVRLKNYGNSPAREFKGWVQVFFCDDPDTYKVRFTIAGRQSVQQLGPGTTVKMPIQTQALPAWFCNRGQILTRQKTILVAGIVGFRDVLGVRRRLTIRYFLDGTTVDGKGQAVLTSANRHNTGN